ncbi:hypothetical protein [Streptomyces sp. LUP30]|uniref:hypothetical protein n=1 Tax=Streptomyces sp. LUP30 TaxID=1890285 RepID=UPI0008519FDC|nr:hypothetical protein [Streptomyces sp. LUP30]
MTRAGRVLAALLAAASLALAHCAVVSWQHHSPPYTALFAACSLLCLTSISHAVQQCSQIHALLTELEQASRPFTTAQDRTVADVLNGACCELWWTSAGAEHDPTRCTRKDHHA